MKWLFEHPQLLLLVVFGIGSLFKSFWEAKKKGEEEINPSPRPRVPIDQDKSYRKVTRSGPPVLPPRTSQPGTVIATAPLHWEMDPAVVAAERAVREEQERMLQHQQNLAAHLRQLRENKATTSGDAAATRARVAKKKKSAPLPTPTRLRARLNDPQELRRAIVLREILDRPVSLR